MPEDKTPPVEFHDAHVSAALDHRSEEHFRLLMEQEKTELPEYFDEVFDLALQLDELKTGPCDDVARKQTRIEELEQRLASISLDCTRKGDPSKKGNDHVNPTLRRINSKHYLDQMSFERFRKRYVKGKEPAPTKAETIRAFKEKHPECKDIPFNTIRKW